jgi:hypothetical protein
MRRPSNCRTRVSKPSSKIAPSVPLRRPEGSLGQIHQKAEDSVIRVGMIDTAKVPDDAPDRRGNN